MDEQSVTPFRPRQKDLTLADIVVTWADQSTTRSITGRQIARLIATAAAQCGNDDALGTPDAAGRWQYQLRGLAALVYPDAGVSVNEADARAVLSNILDQASAELETDLIDSKEWPAKFTVHVKTSA
jgi:hypothetical protein